MEREQQQHRDPAEQRVEVEEIPEAAGEVAARVDRHAVEQVREGDAPDERRADARDRVQPGPEAEPARVMVALAPLERQHAHDQEHEQQQQRDVEAREHRRVPRRERREHGGARDHEPDLVAVPNRADRAEHHVAVFLVPRQDRQQQPDAEVEALEHEVAPEEEGDDAEPELLQVHLSTPSPASRLRRPRRGRAQAGRPWRSAASARRRRRAAPDRGTTNTVRLKTSIAEETAGEFASAVFSRPCTIHGCRPISVSIQPAVIATNGRNDRDDADPEEPPQPLEPASPEQERADERDQRHEAAGVHHHAHAPVDRPHRRHVVAAARTSPGTAGSAP